MKALTKEQFEILRGISEKAEQVEALAKENGLYAYSSLQIGLSFDYGFFSFFLATEPDHKDITHMSCANFLRNKEDVEEVYGGLDKIADLCMMNGKEARIMALENELKELKGE